MHSKHLLPSVRIIRLNRKRYLAITAILLSALAVTNVSSAAGPSAGGRIISDGFESGIGQWQQDRDHRVCSTVTTATDGVGGAHGGSHFLRCRFLSSDGNFGETLTRDISNYNNELFIRFWYRRDQNHQLTSGSTAKQVRIYQHSGNAWRDMYEAARTQAGDCCGLSNFLSYSNTGGPDIGKATYWGGIGSDRTNMSDAWHKDEWYFNHEGSIIKIWHDGVLVRNDSGVGFDAGKWSPIFLRSNWDDGATNPINDMYLDDFEVYSDLGTGGVGLMSNATITQGGGPDITPPNAPVNLRVQ